MEAANQNNPLNKYFRQPKIYITLPSLGKYYGKDSIEFPESGEFPVYSMTGRDEITMKTPDALLNGQATVNVINSCIPHIKNPWQMPSIDVDAVLIAIRIASYGETMDIETTVPNTEKEKTFQVDLRNILEQLVNCDFESSVTVNDLTIHLRPMTYKEFTDNALKTFEEQRIFQTVNDENLNEEEKLKKFNESFTRLTEINMNLVSSSIQAIDTQEERVTDPSFIREFIDHADQKFYSAIIDHVEKQKEKFSIKPFTATTDQEDIDQGAPEQFEVPITFDHSNFFG